MQCLACFRKFLLPAFHFLPCARFTAGTHQMGGNVPVGCMTIGREPGLHLFCITPDLIHKFRNPGPGYCNIEDFKGMIFHGLINAAPYLKDLALLLTCVGHEPTHSLVLEADPAEPLCISQKIILAVPLDNDHKMSAPHPAWPLLVDEIPADLDRFPVHELDGHGEKSALQYSRNSAHGIVYMLIGRPQCPHRLRRRHECNGGFGHYTQCALGADPKMQETVPA